MDHPPPSIRVVADPMDGATDVQRGCISAGSPGGDGGGGEHTGSFPSVRPAPGHGAQDAGLFSAAGATGDGLHLGSPNWSLSLVSLTTSSKATIRPPRSSGIPPSASLSVSGTSTASMAGTPSSRLRPRAPPPDQGDVRAVVPSAGPRPVRLRRSLGGHRRGGAEGPLLRPGPAHSDGSFVKAYPAESTEAFLDGHVSAFAFLGGVPRASYTTIPSWRWPRYWATADASAPGPSPRSSPTTCSTTVSGVPARAMTREK